MNTGTFRALPIVLLVWLMGLSVSAAGAAATLQGMWMDPAGGIFTVRESDGRFIWIGQGAKEGKYFLHKGTGSVQGNTLRGQWIDLPESGFYPSNGSISGTVAGNGLTINWQDGKGYYRQWVRHLDPASAIAASGDPATVEAGSGTAKPGERDRPATWGDVAKQIQSGGTRSPSAPAGNGPQAWSGVAEQLQHPPRTGHDRTPAAPPTLAAILKNADEVNFNEWNIEAALEDPLVWQQPEVQNLIDTWLQRARPELALKDPQAHYEKWGRVVGRGITIAGDPDIREPRLQYLWRNAARFPSLNLCNLKTFVERSLKKESLDSCRTNPTKTLASPALAPPSGKPDTTKSALDRYLDGENIDPSQWTPEQIAAGLNNPPPPNPPQAQRPVAEPGAQPVRRERPQGDSREGWWLMKQIMTFRAQASGKTYIRIWYDAFKCAESACAKVFRDNGARMGGYELGSCANASLIYPIECTGLVSTTLATQAFSESVSNACVVDKSIDHVAGPFSTYNDARNAAQNIKCELPRSNLGSGNKK